MAEDDRRPEEDGPSLELPSLRSAFRGRRKQSRAKHEPPESQVEPRERPADTATTVLPPETEAPQEEPEAKPRRRRRRRPHLRRPRLRRPGWSRRPRRPRNVPGPIAAAIAGAVAGLVLVGGTWAAMHLCTLVRGTPSCGLPGIGLLLLIVVVAALAGSLLMSYLGVAAHASAGALGTGLVVVIVLLALLPYDDHGWMVVVVPGLAVITFVAAWWLTKTYVEPGERPH
jgi:hypothetical protein